MTETEGTTPIIGTASEAAALFAPLFAGRVHELVAIAHLDAGRRLIGLTEHEGEPDGVDLPIRAILEESLRLGSRGLIVAHNHPSGDPTPSPADLDATRRLADTARNLGILLHDHFIFAGEERRSFRELGFL